jgi:hypothetical protein
MQNGLVSDFTKARYYSSVTLLYVLTLLFAFFIFRPFSGGAYSVAASGNLPVEIVKAQPAKQIITGKPLRIVISDVGIDLPIDEGRYNPADGSWSLSGYHAQFAMITPISMFLVR